MNKPEKPTPTTRTVNSLGLEVSGKETPLRRNILLQTVITMLLFSQFCSKLILHSLEFSYNEIMKILCYMLSGKPLTEEICDVLYENAQEMIFYRQRRQAIQCGTKYDGIIESTLEVIEFNGIEVVSFEAELVFQPAGYTKVKYGVRTNFDEDPQMKWHDSYGEII